MSNLNENAIREAAYYIWQNSGCPSGKDEQFWAMAIEQLSSTKTKTPCKSSAKRSCAKKEPTKTASSKASSKKTSK